MRSIVVSLMAALALLAAACSSGGDGRAGGDAAAGGSVAFGGVEDGATVSSPLDVTFEVEGFEVEEAGTVREGAGHMHVLIDVGCSPVGEIVPSDDQHLHFGDGSTSASLELEPGEHELCLQAADGIHTALDLTDEVTVTVD